MILPSPFLDVTRMSTSTVFPRTARLGNCLVIKCFPLAYDLSGHKSGIIRHLLTVGKKYLHAVDTLCLSTSASFENFTICLDFLSDTVITDILK